MRLDPTGKVVTLIRDDAGVAAITTRVRGGEKARGDVAPFVVVRRLPAVPFIGDTATETGEVQTVRYVALCYERKVDDGEALAFVLAGAVAESVQNHVGISYSLSGGRARIFGIQEDFVGPAQRDPVTGEPFVSVNFSVHAAAQVATS